MVTLKPLSPPFAAELGGLDLLHPVSLGDQERLIAAFAEYPVLVFPSQRIDDVQQIAFSERFGDLETTKPGTVGAGSKVVVLTNVGSDGDIVATNHRQTLNGRANQQWHTDSSFKKIAAKASVLAARVLPKTGGQTEFICMRTVYRELPGHLKQCIEGRVCIHDYAHGRGKIDPNFVTNEERVTLPPVRQAMVLDHGIRGKSLYIGAHCVEVVDMDPAESQSLIDELTSFATQEQFIYRHHWRPHDMIMWDNRATLHRASPFSSATEKRYMVRTTIAGDAPTIANGA